jgi:hypothetical protein
MLHETQRELPTHSGYYSIHLLSPDNFNNLETRIGGNSAAYRSLEPTLAYLTPGGRVLFEKPIVPSQ